MGKLSTLPIEKATPTNYDIQPSGTSILIYISGNLVIQGETNPMNFVRVFLLANNNNSYYGKVIHF